MLKCCRVCVERLYGTEMGKRVLLVRSLNSTTDSMTYQYLTWHLRLGSDCCFYAKKSPFRLRELQSSNSLLTFSLFPL